MNPEQFENSNIPEEKPEELKEEQLPENKLKEEQALKTEYNYKKGWREQLREEEEDKIKNWAEKTVKQWHDEVKPDYIFLTETSAVPCGWILKETWKNAYNGEEIPTFYRIDPMYARRINSTRKGLDTETEERRKRTEEYLSEINQYFLKMCEGENPKIIVFDEGWITDNMDGEKLKKYDADNRLFLSIDKNKQDIIINKGGSIKSLLETINFLSVAISEKNPAIWGSQQATKEIFKGQEEDYHAWNKRTTPKDIRDQISSACRERDIKVSDFWNDRMDDPKIHDKIVEIRRYISYWLEPKHTRIEDISRKSIRPTSKPRASRDRDGMQTEDMKIQNLSDYVIPDGRYTKLRGYIVKHPEQRKRALSYIDDLKKLGREAGQKLKSKLEQ